MMKRSAVALMVILPLLAAIPPVDKERAYGTPTAPVRIEVFSDFSCPHCKVLHETMMPQMMKDYISNGKVYLIDRAFPLGGQQHPFSREAAAYAIAAGKVGKYNAVADALFAQQAIWGTNGNVWGAVSSALSPTEQKKVQELAKDPAIAATVEAEYQEGMAAGVNSTPTLIVTVGGKRQALPAAVDYRLLKSMI